MPDKQFSENMVNQFEGFGSTPSDAVWTGIETQLVKDKRKRRFIIWWFSGVLALGLVFSMSFFLNGENVISTNQLASTTIIEKDQIQTENNEESENLELVNSKLSKSSLEQVLTENNKPSDEVHSSDENKMNKNIKSNYSKDGEKLNKNRKLVEIKNISEFEIRRIKEVPIVEEFFKLNEDDNRKITQEREVRNWEKIDSLSLLTINTVKPSTPLLRSAYFVKRKPELNPWYLGLRISQFVTTSPRIEKEPIVSSSGPASLADVSLAPVYTDYSNRRWFEAEIFIQRQFFSRLNIACGLSTSLMKRSYTINKGEVSSGGVSSAQPSSSYTSSNKSYWSFGIPIRIDHYLINTKRFQFGGGVSFLTEYSSVKDLNTQVSGNSFAGLENTSINSLFVNRSLQVSLQPYLKANYFMGSRWDLFLEMGYRKNLLDSSEPTKHTLPSYVSITGGLAWRL